MRDVGTEIIWRGCDTIKVTDELDEENDIEIINDEGVECNVLEDENALKCKLYPDEKGISMLIFEFLIYNLGSKYLNLSCTLYENITFLLLYF